MRPAAEPPPAPALDRAAVQAEMEQVRTDLRQLIRLRDGERDETPQWWGTGRR